MTADEAAFRRAICADPADDLPRLVYADWLGELGRHTEERFIRHQIDAPVSPCRNVPLTVLAHLEPFVGPRPHVYARNVSGSGGATVTYPNGMEFWYRRGFVAEVRGTLAALFGGPCPGCGGAGRMVGHPPGSPYSQVAGVATCPTCRGDPAYRTPGVAAELFAREPVTAVTATTVDAWDFGDGTFGWWREGGPQAHNRATLPAVLFDRLRGYKSTDYGSRRYKTLNMALTAFSQACVNHGRHLAGLSMIDFDA